MGHHNLNERELFQKIKFKVLRTTADSIIKSTIQFFYDNSRGESTATGSGLLLQIENKYFVLTAAHVIAEHYADIYVITPYLAIYLGGMLYHVSLPASGNRTDDKIDLAIMELDNQVVNKLK